MKIPVMLSSIEVPLPSYIGCVVKRQRCFDKLSMTDFL